MSDRLVCSPATPNPATASWELQLQANGRVTMTMICPDSGAGTTFAVNPTGTTGVVNDGQWHRIGVVRNGSEVRLYRDGQMEGFWNNLDGAPALSGLQAGGLRIGAGVCGSSPFTGQLDEITFADRVWTPAELQTPRLHEQLRAR